MKKRKINRLWHGLASLRDYEVRDAMADGGIILVLGNTQMTLTPDKLKNGFSTIRKKMQSKFSDETYSLVDYRYKPDNEKAEVQYEIKL